MTLMEAMARSAAETHAAMANAEMLDDCPEGRTAMPHDASVAMAAIMVRNGMALDDARRRYGLNYNQTEAVKRRVRGLKTRGCKPGQGGRQRTAASFEAERLLREGMTGPEVSEATGLSRAQVYRIAKAISEARAAA